MDGSESTSGSVGFSSTHLDLAHYKHLKLSAIADDIIDLNFRSWNPQDENDLDSVFTLLIENPKHNNNGTLSGGSANNLANTIYGGGWVFDGQSGVSVKPDNPRKGKEGKIVKYESVRGSQQLFIPRVSARVAIEIARKAGVEREFNISLDPEDVDSEFWDWYLSTQLPLIITEGCKKACAGISAGYPTIALNGVYGWGANVRDVYGNIEIDNGGKRIKSILPELEPYLIDREIVMAFDRDSKPDTIKYVDRAMRSFANTVADVCDTFSCLKWRDSKGIDDLIFAKGVKYLDAIYQKRKAMKIEEKNPVGRPRKPSPTPIDRDYQALAQKLGIDLPESGCDADGMPLSKLVKLELDLMAIYGDRLKFNEMSCEVELDRVPIDMNLTKSFIAEANLGDRTQQDCDIAITRIAKLHRYSPVRDYLDSVRGMATQDFIASVPFRYWGNQSELQNYLFFKKLIACVARVMRPGCADHNLLILNGGQGAHKSMALAILSGEEWFTDDLRSIDDKDELAKLSRFWILELAEVDYLFGRKETELFKRFLSGRKDTFRPPYGRSNVTKDRTSALFATTNKSEFLSDPTGSRRYWVVDVGNRIDTERLAIDRDLIWAAALDAYESGVQWWLEDEIDLDNQQANKSYQEVDMLQNLIENNLASVLLQQGSIEYTTVNAIADRILNFATDKQDRKLSVRIVAILRPLGFESKKIRIDGDQKKVWARSMVELSPVPSKKDEYQDEYHLNSLPTLNNTYGTYGTYSYIEESKIKNKNKNEIINNLSVECEKTQVPGLTVPNNAQVESQSHSTTGTLKNNGTQLQQGDRVRIIETHQTGTISSIFRVDDSGTLRLMIRLDDGTSIPKSPHEVEALE